MIEKGVVPEIQVGIFSDKEIGFTLNGVFIEKGSGKKLTGKWTALRSDNRIKLVNGELDKNEIKIKIIITVKAIIK